MSLLDRFRPRWKHSDPHVRFAALQSLDDPSALAEIFETDEHPEVRAAAFARISDQSLLAEIAKGDSEFNVRAAERLTEQRRLADVARLSGSAKVRAAVVARLDDDNLLQRIAAMDEDAEVRALAKQRHEGPDRFRDYLKSTLSKLHVAQQTANRMAEFCGTLDDVCGALVANSRYRINGVVAEPNPATISSTMSPEFSCVELLAGRPEGAEMTANNRMQRVFYRIKIWRQGENDFSGAVEERRYEMASNAVAWSDSSKSD
jgi:hypothetical protein